MDNNNIMNTLELTAKSLNKNNIKAYIVNNKDEVAPLIVKLISKGDIVTTGGSMTLKECGVVDLLNNGNYNFLDKTITDNKDRYIKSFSADAYFCSSNAVTENGELYNVDGTSNRIAAIAYGPKSVIMVVGYNKIVKNIDEAVERVKKIAAPKNCVRLSYKTYCEKKGQCKSCSENNNEMTSGCDSDTRICCNYLVCARQKHKDRIKVILVPEELGY